MGREMIDMIAGLSALGGSLALARAAVVRADEEVSPPIRGLDKTQGGQRSSRTWSVTRAAPAPAQADDVAATTGGATADEVVDTVEISPQAVAKAKADSDNRYSVAVQNLSDEQKQQLDKLRKTDQEVRTHEAAHKAAGGQYAGSASFSYQTGPDGQQYAVGGEVPIDMSPIPNDPQATIQKMQQVRAAAMAPANPSDADRQVAAKAAELAQKAQAEMAAGSTKGAGNGGQGQSGTETFTAGKPQTTAASSASESLESPLLDVYA